MRKRKQNGVDAKVEQAYYASCENIQVNIMDIGKIYEHGRKLVAEGADFEALKRGIRDFVETLKGRVE